MLHNLSFIEDPTRIFRAVRYEDRYGFRMDRHTLALARACAEMDLIGDLSSARLRDELVSLFDEPRISFTLRRLRELGLQHVLHPRLALDDTSAQLIDAVDALRRRCNVAGEVPAWRARLVVTLRDLAPEELEEWVARMKFRRADARVLVRAWLVGTRLERRLSRPLSEADLYEIAHGEPLEALLVAMAVSAGGPVEQRLTQFLRRSRRVRLAINGRDLLEMGYRQSADLGSVLHALLRLKLNGAVAGRRQELDAARRMLGAKLTEGAPCPSPTTEQRCGGGPATLSCATTTAARCGTRRAATAGGPPSRRGWAACRRPPFDTLNLGMSTDDDPAAVWRNRRGFAAAAGVAAVDLVVPGQVHGTTIAEVGGGERGRGARQRDDVVAGTDGLLTREAGVPLFVSFADCVPVVLVAGTPACARGARARRLARDAGRHRGSGGAGDRRLRRPRRRRHRPEHRPLLLRRLAGCRRAASKRPFRERGATGASICGRLPAVSSRRAALPPPTSSRASCALATTSSSSRTAATTGRPADRRRSPGSQEGHR